MDRIVFLMMLFSIFAGCTSSYLVGPRTGRDSLNSADFNDKMRRADVSITLRNGVEMDGYNLRVGTDSFEWEDPRSGEICNFQSDSVGRVVTRNHWLGGIEGFLRGLFGGGAAGAIILKTNGQEEQTPGEALIMAGAMLGGAAVGTIIGLVREHRDEYHIDTQPAEGRK